MKKLIATTIGTVGLLLAVGTTYGQGTIFLQNFDSNAGLFDGAGRTGASASAAGTVVEVMAGATANSLAVVFNKVTSGSATDHYTTTAGDANANGANTGTFFDFGYAQVATVAPSTTGFVQVIAWRGAATFALAQTTPGAWWGQSAVWSQTFGTPAQASPPVFQQPTSLAIPGPIQLNLVPTPEPATLALGGLGAAALLLFRRRK